MLVLDEESCCLWWLVEYDLAFSIGGIGCSFDMLLRVKTEQGYVVNRGGFI